MNAKNHTISKIVAKTFLRLLIITLAFSVYLFFSDKNMNMTLHFTNEWVLIFPLLLFLTVFTLLIYVLKNKYALIELNWLFSLATAFFCIYLILLYTRIYETL